MSIRHSIYNTGHPTDNYRLPIEVLDVIFRHSNPSPSHLLQCMLVCKRWHPELKIKLYRNITIDVNFNVRLFLNCLQNYNLGHLVETLSICSTSMNNRRPPLSDPNDSSRLVSYCQNIRYIQMRDMKSYYFLGCLAENLLPELEMIDVCWETCSSQPAAKTRFYDANFLHRGTIKYITMPDSEDDFDRLHLEQYFAAFENLHYVSFKN